MNPYKILTEDKIINECVHKRGVDTIFLLRLLARFRIYYLWDVGYQQQTVLPADQQQRSEEKMADGIKIVLMLLFDLRYAEINEILMFFRRW